MDTFWSTQLFIGLVVKLFERESAQRHHTETAISTSFLVARAYNVFYFLLGRGRNSTLTFGWIPIQLVPTENKFHFFFYWLLKTMQILYLMLKFTDAII
jgi:hypothetical protein